MLTDFILYQKFDDFCLYLFPIIDRFDRKEKFALCTQIKNSCYAFMQNIIDVHRATSQKALYYKLDGQLEFLRWLLRHSHERGYLSRKSFKVSALKTDEIGRILGRLMNPLPKAKDDKTAAGNLQDSQGLQ